MIQLKGKAYRLCLLDTNILSEMLKNPPGEFRVFTLKFLAKSWIPVFSLFSVFEIRRRPDLFELFLDYFSGLPSIILKGHEQLLEEELAAYPDPSRIDPVLLSPLGITPPKGLTRRQALERVLSSDFFIEREQYWNQGISEILSGILSLVDNFPPRQGKYGKSMIREFVDTNVFQQVAMRWPNEVKDLIQALGDFNPLAFPSIRIMALTVFMKFYCDNRIPCESDVFDMIISSPIPYIDGVITERHQAAVLRKGKELGFLSPDLEIHTIKALRQ